MKLIENIRILKWENFSECGRVCSVLIRFRESVKAIDAVRKLLKI